MSSAILSNSTGAFPVHTPELTSLFAKLNETRVALAASKAHGTLASLRSPEYAASKAAYRAYWCAVDADRAAKASA